MSVWFSNNFLLKCEKASKGVVRNLEPGCHIARGYADLGFEEFLLLHNSKIVSLFTGKVTDLPLDHHDHFFIVLSIDETLEEIAKLGFAPLSIELVDGRGWVLRISPDTAPDFGGSIEEYEGEGLHDACINALVAIVETGSTKKYGFR